MSDTETVKSDPNQSALPVEATDFNQGDKADAPRLATEPQNAVAQDAIAQVAESKVNPTGTGSATVQETNVYEIVNGNAPTNAAAATECTKEAAENSVSKDSETEPKEEPVVCTFAMFLISL